MDTMHARRPDATFPLQGPSHRAYARTRGLSSAGRRRTAQRALRPTHYRAAEAGHTCSRSNIARARGRGGNGGTHDHPADHAGRWGRSRGAPGRATPHRSPAHGGRHQHLAAAAAVPAQRAAYLLHWRDRLQSRGHGPLDQQLPAHRHIDCYDGRNPGVFVPPQQPHEDFQPRGRDQPPAEPRRRRRYIRRAAADRWPCSSCSTTPRNGCATTWAGDLVPAGPAAHLRQQGGDGAYRQPRRGAQRAQHPGQGAQLRATQAHGGAGGPGLGPRGAGALRRLRSHHLLHQGPQGVARARRRRSSPSARSR